MTEQQIADALAMFAKMFPGITPERLAQVEAQLRALP